MNIMNAARVGAVVGWLAAALAAQSDWQLRGGHAEVRVVGPSNVVMTGPRDQRSGLEAGDYEVVFGADAAGMPGRLAFPVPAMATVQLATSAAAAAPSQVIDLRDPQWVETTGPDTLRTIGGRDSGDYRVAATVAIEAANPVVGLVARWQSADEFYAFLVDNARGEVRLERRLGPKPLVLARATVPTMPAGPRTLALQVHGFRLQAFVDDRAVLQVFDGGITRGAHGLCWQGPAPAWRTFAVSPPAAPRASAALVIAEPGRATLHASTPVSPGHWYVLELGLDRPHPLVPLELTGLEPGLLQRPAAPHVISADWCSALGRGGIGEVPSQGVVRCAFEWPALPALRLQAAFARLLLVTADGEAIGGATPPVPLVF
jgi:hypothetical protein